MLPRLIDERGGEQLRRIELANRKAIKPCFPPACAATNPKAVRVPLPHLDPITAAAPHPAFFTSFRIPGGTIYFSEFAHHR